MREIFSVRFFAAAGAVVGLFFLLTTFFATRDAIDGDDRPDGAEIELHKVDLVEQVFSSRNPSFRVDSQGLAASDTDLIIDGARAIRVVIDTPAEDHCPGFGEIGACAVVADLLGEAVVWFALVPMGSNRTVELPAIDTLDDGLATLVNGWQLPFAPVLDRRCRDEAFESFREFRALLDDDFTSIFGIEDRRLIAVECRTRVAYAPELGRSGTLGSTATSVVTRS